MNKPVLNAMGRREFIGTTVLAAASVGALPTGLAASRQVAPAKSKRDLMMQVLDKSGTPNYIPAGFFLHFPLEQRTGDAAIKAHLDYFRATGMDFVKIQFEQSYTGSLETITRGVERGREYRALILGRTRWHLGHVACFPCQTGGQSHLGGRADPPWIMYRKNRCPHLATERNCARHCRPRMGGPAAFWLSALSSLQQPLTELGHAIPCEDWETLIHPHPISGPLDVRQRFEFLRFHIDRHRNQVLALGLH